MIRPMQPGDQRERRRSKPASRPDEAAPAARPARPLLSDDQRWRRRSVPRYVHRKTDSAKTRDRHCTDSWRRSRGCRTTRTDSDRVRSGTRLPVRRAVLWSSLSHHGGTGRTASAEVPACSGRRPVPRFRRPRTATPACAYSSPSRSVGAAAGCGPGTVDPGRVELQRARYESLHSALQRFERLRRERWHEPVKKAALVERAGPWPTERSEKKRQGPRLRPHCGHRMYLLLKTLFRLKVVLVVWSAYSSFGASRSRRRARAGEEPCT